jgi:hypothetical protein
MTSPLSRAQEMLRGRKIEDMTLAQLRTWIKACDRMEVWPLTAAKARRGWKASRVQAEAELARRGAKVKPPT